MTATDILHALALAGSAEATATIIEQTITTNMKTNTPKHTKGPWVANKIPGKPTFNVRSGEDSIACVYSHVGSPSLMDRADEGPANARLIATAPSILSALQNVMEFLDTYAELFDVNGKDLSEDFDPIAEEAHRAINDAIG